MKILIVSDIHHFSTLDLFEGYIDAFKQIRDNDVEVEFVNMLELNNFYNMEKAWAMVMAKFLNIDNAFTHMLFISGVVVPSWLIKSKYNKKIGIIATDDPHSSVLLAKNKEYIDYWFTNEKKIEDEKNNIFYLPTATDSKFPNVTKDDIPVQYRCHLSFVGTVYDDRIKPLEEICNFAYEKGLVFKIVGPLLKTPKDSIIRKYAQEIVIPNKEAKMIYRGSDVVINLDRNIHWNPTTTEGNPHLIDIGTPYSGNPRMYEVAGCRTTQLFVSPRQEVKDIFGDNVYYCEENNIKDALINIFENESEETKLNKINTCYFKVIESHLYKHRAEKILSILKREETKTSLARLEQLIIKG